MTVVAESVAIGQVFIVPGGMKTGQDNQMKVDLLTHRGGYCRSSTGDGGRWKREEKWKSRGLLFPGPLVGGEEGREGGGNVEAGPEVNISPERQVGAGG